MPRRLSILLASGCLLAAHPVRAVGQKDVPFVSTAIEVTGPLTQFPAAAKLFTLDAANGNSNNTASFYAAWDDQSLYLAWEVQDEALQCTPVPADSTAAWDNDGVEVSFDTKNKKTLSPGDQDFRQWIFPLSFSNNAYDAYGSGSTGDPSFTGHAKVGFQLTGTLNDEQPDTGYSSIVAIPWTDLGLTPGNGLSFGCDPALNDLDSVTGSTTVLDWANVIPYAQPAQWGSLTLTGKGGMKTDGGATPTDAGTARRDGGTTSRPDRESGASRPDPGCDCRVAGHGSSTPRSLEMLGWLFALFFLTKQAHDHA